MQQLIKREWNAIDNASISMENGGSHEEMIWPKHYPLPLKQKKITKQKTIC